MENPPQELLDILATTPREEVIAKIEELNPPWKKDLVPWQVAQPGEKIPWQAVYGLMKEPLNSDDIEWAKRELIKLGLMEDA